VPGGLAEGAGGVICTLFESARVRRKRQRTGALQDLAEVRATPSLATAFWTAGVSRRVIESVGMNIAIMINPPVQSVLNQNVEAELWDSPGGCRQCGLVMGCSEGASFHGPVGLRLGQTEGRASPQWAKSVGSASVRSLPVTAGADSGWRSEYLVNHAITSDTWLDHITDEVPRCLPPPAGVSNGYKQHAKGRRHASAAGTVSYRPRPQGWQQSRSTRSGQKGSAERQNRIQSVNTPVTRTVSRAIEATKWLAGTSFRQPARTLRNILTGTVAVSDGPSTTW
jgi:hypothetical protein